MSMGALEDFRHFLLLRIDGTGQEACADAERASTPVLI